MNEYLGLIPFKIIIYILVFMLGGSIGSYSKCTADRYGARDKSARSHCDSCERTLMFYELIPVFSYIFLRGRCKECNNKIGIDSFICEIISAIIFLLVFVRFGVSIETILGFVLYALLLIPSLIDIRLMIIPNVFPLSLFIVWVIKIVFDNSNVDYLGSILGALLIPGLILVISLLFRKMLKKDAMGMGDIKILIGTGLILGFEKSLLNVFIMCIIGIFFAIIQKKKKGEAFPLMPSICLSTMITYLFGNTLVNNYTNII